MMDGDIEEVLAALERENAVLADVVSKTLTALRRAKMSLNRYPTSFPIIEATVVINKILGRDPKPSLDDAVEAAWWVIGFGASKAVPADVHAAAEQVVYTTEQVAAMLEAAINGQLAAQAGFPWELVLPILLDLWREWRKERRKS